LLQKPMLASASWNDTWDCFSNLVWVKRL